jgi:hypothetical protein
LLRAVFVRSHCRKEVNDVHHYDIVLNTERFSSAICRADCCRAQTGRKPNRCLIRPPQPVTDRLDSKRRNARFD